MSSIRNTFQRRNHKERAQPTERSRLGLLEKHKDYALRAKDHNKKKAQLRALRQKAADKNEDEFFFGMLSRSGPGTFASKGKRWKGTVDGDRGNRAMDVDTVRLLKTQDMGYLRTQRTLAMKEVKNLEERVIQLGGSIDPNEQYEDDEDDDDDDMGGLDDLVALGKKGRTGAANKLKKIVFADAEDERDEMIDAEVDRAEGIAGGRAEDADLEQQDLESLRADQRKRLLEKLRRRLQGARRKASVLARAENELEIQRAGMAKTRTVGGVRKSGKKIKVRERKR